MGTISDAATGICYRVRSECAELTPDVALRIESGLERTIVGQASPSERWRAYRHCVRTCDWSRLRAVTSLFARRRVCSHPARTILNTIVVTAPLAAVTALAAVMAFLPIYVASGWASEIPAGCAAMALHVWISAALPRIARTPWL